MSSRVLLRSALIVLALGAVPAHAGNAAQPLSAVAPAVGDFSADKEAFDIALSTWKTKLKVTTDRAEKRALRKAHPAVKFAARMRAHVTAGDLSAAEWCLEYLKDMDLKRSDREDLRVELYSSLIASTDSAQRERTLKRMMNDSQLLRGAGLEGLEGIVRQFIEKEPNPELRGQAMFKLAARFATRGNDRQKAWAEETLAALISGTSTASDGEPIEMTLSAGDRAEAEKFLFALQHLAIGRMAPDFDGKTIDGEPVSLANARGKVTVIDFFGFW